VDCAKRRFNTQHDDQTLDLTPAAKVEVIADMAAVLRPVCGLNTRRFAELVDERFGLGDVAWLNI
jgi:hypothetical protein